MSETVVIERDDEPGATGSGDSPRGEQITAADLQNMLDRERAARRSEEERRLSAERRLAAAEAGARDAMTAAGGHLLARFAAEERGFDDAMTAAQGEEETLTARLADLMADGDHAAAAQVQVRISKLAARQESLSVQKAMLLRDKAATERAAAAPLPQARAEAPEDGAVDMSRFSAAARRWAEEHPRYLTDRAMQLRIVAEHHAAIADGVQQESPEYFERLDGVYETAGSRAPKPALERRPAVLPVSRESGRAGGERVGEIKLSADEREAADITMPEIPVADYVDPGGVKRPGRYRFYKQMQDQTRSEGRIPR